MISDATASETVGTRNTQREVMNRSAARMTQIIPIRMNRSLAWRIVAKNTAKSEIPTETVMILLEIKE